MNEKAFIANHHEDSTKKCKTFSQQFTTSSGLDFWKIQF